jgi:hypothetical protein
MADQKTRNTWRCKFSRASLDLQLKVIKKLSKKATDLKALINDLYRVDPFISEWKNGTVNLLTDHHVFN